MLKNEWYRMFDKPSEDNYILDCDFRVKRKLNHR